MKKEMTPMEAAKRYIEIVKSSTYDINNKDMLNELDKLWIIAFNDDEAYKFIADSLLGIRKRPPLDLRELDLLYGVETEL